MNKDEITNDKAAIETAIDKLVADQQQIDQETVTSMENDVITQASDIAEPTKTNVLPLTVIEEAGSSQPETDLEIQPTPTPVTDVEPIPLTLSQVLDGYIANTNVEAYQLDNTALQELKAAISVISAESQSVLAASILFHFKDKV